jgi:hypothetical protein
MLPSNWRVETFGEQSPLIIYFLNLVNILMILTKTDYILWRECKKNAWLKIHKPEIYNEQELSEFEQQIIETGNEVELEARKLFPSGVLLKGRGEKEQEKTQELLAKKTNVIFQPVFEKDGFLAAVDVLELQNDGSYFIYEIKATSDVDSKTHYHDLAFQINLLEKFGLTISKAFVIHFNSEYVRHGEIEINKLFSRTDVTEKVEDKKPAVLLEMSQALRYLSQEEEPTGYCDCIYKGRSAHCSTFKYSNPKVPDYGVHDISRIGSSKKKLQELIDVGILELKDVPESTDLSVTQKNQIKAYVQDTIFKDAPSIKKELGDLDFPLYFLDYETFPCAIPRFDGFGPYQQIPFQYSLYILDSPESEPRHLEFLYIKADDPTPSFLKSLQKDIDEGGTVVVWNKKFECKINEEAAERYPDFKSFIGSLNDRVYDLMDIFSNQWYVHKDFKGKVSIKNILPVLAPDLSYKELNIQEGGSASQQWNEMVNGGLAPAEQRKIATDLKVYCGLDTFAMYRIWHHLYNL